MNPLAPPNNGLTELKTADPAEGTQGRILEKKTLIWGVLEIVSEIYYPVLLLLMGIFAQR